MPQSTVIQIKAIEPRRKWYPKAFVDAVRKAAEREMDIIERMYEKTVSTWENKPRWVKDVSVSDRRVTIVVRLDKRLNASKIYSYLDFGTKKRWALMSSNFSPKTTPKVIGSRGGAGRVVVRGRSAMTARGIGARPGIKKREFSKEIAKRRRKFWFKNMRKAMQEAANRVWK